MNAALPVCFACYFRDNPSLHTRDQAACSLVAEMMHRHVGTTDVIHSRFCAAHKEIVSCMILIIKEEDKKRDKT
jgi:hypothetical protein